MPSADASPRREALEGAGDVAHAAWIGAGRPRHDCPTYQGDCARCGRVDDLEQITTALQRRFSSFDGWQSCSGGLCPPCRWTYTTRSLRMRSMLVTRHPPALEELTLPRLRQILAEPVPVDVALTVVVHPERGKHLLPTARWGMLAVDDACIRWTHRDVSLLALVEQLRAQGCPVAALTDPAPPWRWLTTLGPGERVEAMSRWPDLNPWRRRGPWLEIAVLATAPPTLRRRR